MGGDTGSDPPRRPESLADHAVDTAAIAALLGIAALDPEPATAQTLGGMVLAVAGAKKYAAHRRNR